MFTWNPSLGFKPELKALNGLVTGMWRPTPGLTFNILRKSSEVIKMFSGVLGLASMFVSVYSGFFVS